KAHIEYFKYIETIYQTKYEILKSDRLRRAYIYEENKSFTPPDMPYIPAVYFPQNVGHVEATLEGTSFSLEIGGKSLEFQTKILGTFNVINISAAIAIAKDLGMEYENIIKQVQKLEPIEHRLNKISTYDKLILDDSYNGNIDGMLESIRIASLHHGRKVIVTPGLIESDEESNLILAKAMDDIFDIVIITGELNAKILKDNIYKPLKIVLKDKNSIEGILKSTTQSGDLILFANDAPSYI
ncbi:MAG: UDP-N-acetylmuramoyl-tripeptide--D-alanyl-D-alanine ligase, partial [Helicobacter sp.]|nr:UDP-N-acetylmuramoyl-tripeptide--D-alanyl-D-alanine ligase [Helicobacter sp.]